MKSEEAIRTNERRAELAKRKAYELIRETGDQACRRADMLLCVQYALLWAASDQDVDPVLFCCSRGNKIDNSIMEAADV